MASPDTVWIILSVTTFCVSTEAASTVESGSASCQISLVLSLTAAVEAISAAVLAVVPTNICPSPADGDGLTLELGEIEALGELETEELGDTDEEGEIEADAEGDSDALGEREALGLFESEALAEGLTLELGEIEVELDGDIEPDGLKLCEPDGEVE